MGWGTGNLGGGSGGGLNFKVVAYSTESNLLSATPKENTIGVITTNEITGWVFSATAPNSPVDGVVWFSTGTSSGVEFNALKKNGIQVYPISAKQYVSSKWVNKTAKTYQNGAWRDWWDGSILMGTNQYESVTGGWQTAGGIGTSVAINSSGIEFTRFSTSDENTSWAYAITKKKIDLTKYKTLSFDCKVLSGGFGSEIGVSMTTPGTGDLVAKSTPSSSTEWQSLTLNISSVTGEAYIVARAKKNAASYNNIKLS